MLSLSGLLFVWETADLVMSWHVPHLPKWLRGGVREVFVKSLVVDQKILILKRGLIMEGLQGLSGENRTLHNCSIIN